jgi:hypothetical protein
MKAIWEDEYEMPDEIDFSKLKRVPNPFSQRFRDLNLVSLDNDVAKAFPDSESVNTALRRILAERSRVTAKSYLSKAS